MSDRATGNLYLRLPLFLLKNLWSITIGTLAIIILLNILGLWHAGNRFMAGVHAFLTAPPPQPQVDGSNLIVHQVRNASELTTAVFAMEAVVPAHQNRTLGKLVVGKTSLLYTAYGEVRAGVDLSQLTSDKIRIENNTVYVQLPAPKILDSKIDVNRSEVYDYDRGFLGLGPDAAPQLQTLAQRETLEKIVQNACTQGLLNTANERAELAVTQLLATAGYDQVEVQTTPPDLQACQAAASEL
jgi:predicted transcriptional regulator